MLLLLTPFYRFFLYLTSSILIPDFNIHSRFYLLYYSFMLFYPFLDSVYDTFSISHVNRAMFSIAFPFPEDEL